MLEWATDATILPGGNRRAGALTTAGDPSSPFPAPSQTAFVSPFAVNYERPSVSPPSRPILSHPVPAT